MIVNLPCDCPEEEHEIVVIPEYYLNKIGYYGPTEGDLLPCGRAITENDTLVIVDRIRDSEIRED